MEMSTSFDIEMRNDDYVIINDDELPNDAGINHDASVQRPSRERRPPDRFGEWFTVASDEITEPPTVDEALNGRDANLWRDAVQHEMDSLLKQNVVNLVELPNRRKAVGSKWVFRVQRNADGLVERSKDRPVAQGYSQNTVWTIMKHPVVRFESLRTVVGLSVKQELKLNQMDLTTRKGYVVLATYGRLAPVFRTNRVIECNVKCWCFNP